VQTAAEIQADIDAIRAARTTLAKGERVEEVWREGRRLIYGKVTIETLTQLLLVLQSDYELAAAGEGIETLLPRRRSAITHIMAF
jgi:hypothetical protein